MISALPITAESECERILKIGQHLPKLWARIKMGVFSEHGVYIRFISTQLFSAWQFLYLTKSVTV